MWPAWIYFALERRLRLVHPMWICRLISMSWESPVLDEPVAPPVWCDVRGNAELIRPGGDAGLEPDGGAAIGHGRLPTLAR